MSNVTSSPAAATLAASSACSFLHGTAFAEAFREGGQDALRRAFNTAMAAPCAAMPDALICQSDKHREQICAEWFMRRGACGDNLVEYRTQNRQLCAATQAVATDYPELDTTRSGAPASQIPPPPSLATLQSQMEEMRVRCETANVPLFQSMHGQARREFPTDATQADAAVERALSTTMQSFCETVRAHPDASVQAAFPMCADRTAQAATCAGWFLDARCDGPANREFAETHPALCAAARRARLPVSER